MHLEVLGWTLPRQHLRTAENNQLRCVLAGRRPEGAEVVGAPEVLGAVLRPHLVEAVQDEDQLQVLRGVQELIAQCPDLINV